MITPFAFSEAGGHPANEDAYLVEPHPHDPECWVCAVADGQGGRAGGARAAQVAYRTVLEAASALSAREVMTPAAWATIFRRADEAVAADRDAGFTTLVGFAVSGDRLCGASNGDSALVTVDGRGTRDEVTRGQRKNPPVGSEVAACVPFAVHLAPPWLVLAMTDGVWKYVGWEYVREAAGRLRGSPLIAALKERARLPGTGRLQDDFTLVVLQSGPAGMA